MSAIAEICDQEKKSIRFKRMLMATDFSQASRRALDYALVIARRYGSALSVLHAIPPEPRESIPLEPLPHELNPRSLEAEAQMKRLGQQIEISDLNCQLLLEHGPVWDVLSSAMEHEHTDLLVVGTHGRGGLKKLALGSVAEEVLHRAHCPVLTVGPNVDPASSARTEFTNILFATDFGPASANASRYVLSLAEEYRAKLLLLHMMPPMPSPDLGPAAYGPPIFGAEALTKWQSETRDQSMKKLKSLLPSSAKLAFEPRYVVGVDFLPEGILQTAAAHKIDLIVMGANRTRSPRIAAHMPWSLTHAVICQARCPVLTVCE